MSQILTVLSQDAEARKLPLSFMAEAGEKLSPEIGAVCELNVSRSWPDLSDQI
jgi:hypothetical protein